MSAYPAGGGGAGGAGGNDRYDDGYGAAQPGDSYYQDNAYYDQNQAQDYGDGYYDSRGLVLLRCTHCLLLADFISVTAATRRVTPKTDTKTEATMTSRVATRTITTMTSTTIRVPRAPMINHRRAVAALRSIPRPLVTSP